MGHSELRQRILGIAAVTLMLAGCGGEQVEPADPPRLVVPAQEDENSFLKELAAALQEVDWDTEARDGYIRVTRAGSPTFLLDYRHQRGDVDRVIITAIFQGAEGNLTHNNQSALRQINQVNNDVNLTKVSMDSEGDIWFQTTYPFYQELDIRALVIYLDWYDRMLVLILADLTEFIQ